MRPPKVPETCPMVRSFFRMVGKVARALELRVDGELSPHSPDGGPVHFYEGHESAVRLNCRMIAGPSVSDSEGGLAIPQRIRRPEVSADGAAGETALAVWAVPLDGTVDAAFGQVGAIAADGPFVDWKQPDSESLQRVRERAVDRALA